MPLNKNDLKEINNLLEPKFKEYDSKLTEQDARIDKKFADMMKFCLDTFVTKIEFEELKAQVALLPTREEFFSRMDTMMAMLETHNMERISLGKKVDRIDKRLHRVENLPQIASQLS